MRDIIRERLNWCYLTIKHQKIITQTHFSVDLYTWRTCVCEWSIRLISVLSGYEVQSWWDEANCVEPLNSLVTEPWATLNTHTCVADFLKFLFFSLWRNKEMSEKVAIGKYWALVASLLFQYLVLHPWNILDLKIFTAFLRKSVQLLFTVINFCLVDEKAHKSRALWFTQSWKCRWNCGKYKW